MTVSVSSAAGHLRANVYGESPCATCAKSDHCPLCPGVAAAALSIPCFIGRETEAREGDWPEVTQWGGHRSWKLNWMWVL